MSSIHLVLLIGAVGVVWWWGRRMPLAGMRKRVALGARAMAVVALCAALWGGPHRRVQETPRHIVYLVDRSASIDASQTAWMARRIASLESVRPAQLERALIAFGAEAQMLVPFGREPLTDPEYLRSELERARIDRQQTNLESALLAALTLMPPHRGGSVVVLSDGRETTGNVTEVLAYVRRAGLLAFPSPAPPSSQAKTLWDQLVVPPVVQRGAPVPMRLVVFGGAATMVSGEVTIALEGVTIKRQRVTVRPGWQVFTVSVPAIQRGTMALDVRLNLPSEGVSEDRRMYTEVEGPPQLLFIADRAAALPALVSALKRREIDVAVGHPSDLPIDSSLDYDAVMFFNIPKSAVLAEQAAALRRYIEERGGGLIMAGLGGELATEITTPAPIDPLLPIQFEPKGLQETKRRVCIILLIDRSASMLGPRIAATKRAAVELVKQLSPEDLVGVLAFDTKPYVVVEVQPAGQVGAWLVEKLVRLRSTGGTDVYPALTAAANRLELTGATLKHIILLSDGNTPFREEPYQELVDSFKLSGTTVSTIGIGAAFINTDYLQWLAGATGGTFYQMRNLNELPRLIARDTERELGRLPFTEGYFQPSKTPMTDWFVDTAHFPTLRGYFTASAKPDARVDLTVNGGGGDLPALSAVPGTGQAGAPNSGQTGAAQAGLPALSAVPGTGQAGAPNSGQTGAAQAGDPLLARWSMGQGRVVSFTSDADVRWSPEWIRWPGFDSAWAQIVRWAMRPRLTEELFVSIDRSRGGTELMVEGELHDPKGELLSADGRGGRPVSLVQTGRWRWHASIDQVPSGWYQLALESRLPAPPNSASAGAAQAGLPAPPIGGAPAYPATDVAAGRQAGQDDAVVFAKRWVQIGTPASLREMPGQPPQESLLRQIAQSTGGAYDTPDRAFVPPTTTATITEPLFTWWLPLVILMLLIDIALRGASML